MKKLPLILLKLTLLVCSGCASIPDVIVCADKGDSGFCRWTLTDESFRLEGQEWERFQDGRFSLSPEGFAKYQTFIEQICSNYDCKRGEKEQLEQVKKSLEQGRVVK